MITLKELNPKGVQLTDEQHSNLLILHQRINVVRTARSRPMYVTSGVRSESDHKRIYMEKARKQGLTNIRIPMGSAHLKGAAVDIADPDGSVMTWCKNNVHILESAQLWCEDGTVGWVHFQIYPPKSGRRFFLP